MNHSLFTRLLIVAGVATIPLFAQNSAGAESPEALVKQVFAALERKDSAALQQLSISPDDFKKFVWPTFTAPPTGTSAEKFYKMYTASSGVGIDEYLKQYRGRKVEVLKVTMNPPSKQTKRYRLMPGAQIALRDESGQEKTSPCSAAFWSVMAITKWRPTTCVPLSERQAMVKPKVLFLCTGNSCRTQMAEAFLRELGGDRFEVTSAGDEPTPLDPYAIEAMGELDIDISQQGSKSVSRFLGQSFTYVITLCDRQQERSCPIFPGAIWRHQWNLENPGFAQSPEDRRATVRRVRDQIQKQVVEFVSHN